MPTCCITICSGTHIDLEVKMKYKPYDGDTLGQEIDIPQVLRYVEQTLKQWDVDHPRPSNHTEAERQACPMLW